jgi:hypothetical protein
MLKASLRAASGVLTCTQICFLDHENSIGAQNMLRPTVQHLEIYIYKIAGSSLRTKWAGECGPVEIKSSASKPI